MTFSDLRALIQAEMPPGWVGVIEWIAWLMEGGSSRIQLTYWDNRRNDPHYTRSADTPESLLAAWRELKGRLA